MATLSTLVNDYYYNKISFVEYREQRSHLLKLIDKDLNGVEQEEIKAEEDDGSIINKALSFLKIDKFKESD